MARRRMFTVELMDSDRFSDLPVNVQMLYIYMSTHADDEGFVSGGRRMARLYNCPEGLEQLEQADFIIRFPSGVLAVTDWFINNTIRKDRSMPTIYQAERRCLSIQNDRYVLMATNCQPDDNQMTTTCQPNDNQVATQNRIEENRTEDNITEKNISEKISPEQINPEEEFPDLNKGNGWGIDDYLKRKQEQDRRGETDSCENSYLADMPSLADVRQYCANAKLQHINAWEFWHYFNQNRWMDKDKQPVHDWRALAKSWDARKKRLAEPVPKYNWTIGTVL